MGTEANATYAEPFQYCRTPRLEEGRLVTVSDLRFVESSASETTSGTLAMTANPGVLLFSETVKEAPVIRTGELTSTIVTST